VLGEKGTDLFFGWKNKSVPFWVMMQLHMNYPAVEVVRWTVDHGVVTMSPKKMGFRSIPIIDQVVANDS
jgi:hypothetical protein